jgi:hypothetical protein
MPSINTSSTTQQHYHMINDYINHLRSVWQWQALIFDGLFNDLDKYFLPGLYSIL